MPVYDYECGKCAHKFEMRRSLSEGASATCPKCHSEAERVFAPVPIVFKGAGFYVTDYRKEPAPSENSSSCGSGCNNRLFNTRQLLQFRPVLLRRLAVRSFLTVAQQNYRLLFTRRYKTPWISTHLWEIMS
jgi:putative FmdB family regulatory protein